MAKTKRRVSRARQIRIPILTVAGLIPAVSGTWQFYQGYKSWRMALNWLCQAMTGYDFIENKWELADLKMGLMPAALGILGSKFLGGRLGINRILGNLGVPFIRL